MQYTYEQYLKAIVPLVLAGGAFLAGWVEGGVLNRAELANVVELAVVALLVFLVPNVKRERKPKPLTKTHPPANSSTTPTRRRSDAR